MKNFAMQPSVQLDDETKQQLTQEVKETLAIPADDNENEDKRTFTTADMWNRNRRGRYADGVINRWHLS